MNECHSSMPVNENGVGRGEDAPRQPGNPTTKAAPVYDYARSVRGGGCRKIKKSVPLWFPFPSTPKPHTYPPPANPLLRRTRNTNGETPDARYPLEAERGALRKPYRPYLK